MVMKTISFSTLNEEEHLVLLLQNIDTLLAKDWFCDIVLRTKTNYYARVKGTDIPISEETYERLKSELEDA